MKRRYRHPCQSFATLVSLTPRSSLTVSLMTHDDIEVQHTFFLLRWRASRVDLFFFQADTIFDFTDLPPSRIWPHFSAY
jgi:hypothetical protein